MLYQDEDGRPSMDLFKAIFADSESSSSDSEEDEDQGDKQQEEKPVGKVYYYYKRAVSLKVPCFNDKQ